MKTKIVYCVIWSCGLFVATFYGLLKQKDIFEFTEKLFLPVMQNYIFPMILAMALYLLDVLYNVTNDKSNGAIVGWVLGTIILFMVFFALSMLVNENWAGWLFFSASWFSLTILKYKTTDCEKREIYKVMED